MLNPQRMLGALLNYLYNESPTDGTFLLPSHFSFILYYFGAYSLHFNKLYSSVYCKWHFNSWLPVAPVAVLSKSNCCGAEDATFRHSGQLCWAWIDRPWLALKSVRKPESYIQTVRACMCNSHFLSILPLFCPLKGYSLNRGLVIPIYSFPVISCAVLK